MKLSSKLSIVWNRPVLFNEYKIVQLVSPSCNRKRNVTVQVYSPCSNQSLLYKQLFRTKTDISVNCGNQNLSRKEIMYNESKKPKTWQYIYIYTDMYAIFVTVLPLQPVRTVYKEHKRYGTQQIMNRTCLVCCKPYENKIEWSTETSIFLLPKPVRESPLKQVW